MATHHGELLLVIGCSVEGKQGSVVVHIFLPIAVEVVCHNVEKVHVPVDVARARHEHISEAMGQLRVHLLVHFGHIVATIDRLKAGRNSGRQ